MAEEKKTYTPEEVEAWLNSSDANANLADTSDQEFTGTDFAPFAKGNRDFMIVAKPELKKADSGALMLYNMQLKVDVDGQDRRVWANIVIHPNTIRTVKSFLLCIGERDKQLSAMQIWNETFAEELVGRSGNAYFDIDPNPGYKPKNIVKYWNNEFAKARRNSAPDGGTETKPLLGAGPDDMPFVYSEISDFEIDRFAHI